MSATSTNTAPKIELNQKNDLSLPPIRNIENFIRDISAREHVVVPKDPKELGIALSELGSQVKRILPSSQFIKTDDALSKLKAEDQYVALHYIKSRFENAKNEVTAFTTMLTSLI